MLISQNELKKYGIDLSVSELEEKLIQLGHEVEEVVVYENDKLVVGYVESIKAHPDADKLNVCQVNIGDEVVQIVCGAPNVDQGQYVIVATIGAVLPGDFKIKKSKIRGQESFGMICSIAELGFDKNNLVDKDYDFIYNFKSQPTPGSSALSHINLDDNILDLGLTANRGDCQSYTGVVRDLRALYNDKHEIEEFDILTDVEADFEVFNTDADTDFLSAIKINNVEVVQSSEEVRFFLALHNMKPQNNIVDYANYSMMQTGIPMHTYDADKLVGNIKTVVLDKEAKFVAIDEKEYTLPAGTLTIQDDEKIVSIASVIGSFETRVTDSTKNLLVEIGHFDPVKVRISATSIFKKTDASMRGEKNVDSVAVFAAYKMFNDLVKKEKEDVVISDLVFSNEIEIRSKLIKLNHFDVFKVLGIDISIDEVKTILSNLHFELVREADNELTYLVPTWRFDIFNDHDLIEEVIRVYSMDKILDSEVLPSFNLKHNIITDKKVKIERDLENLVLSLGLDQVVTYSLVSEEELLAFGGDIDKSVELMMPLSSKRRYYRQSLLPSLLETAKYNLDRQQDSSSIFEIANVYTKEADEIIETFKLAGLMVGAKHNSFVDGMANYDFYDLKGVVESIFNHYNMEFEITVSDNAHDELNPYATANIIHDGIVVGFIGLKHVNYFKKIKQDVIMFEVDLGKIDHKLIKEINYKKVVSNPSVVRDLTFNCAQSINYSEVESIFEKIAHLQSVKLKDIYEGENIKDGMRAITLALEFNSAEVTLTGEIVDASIDKIVRKAVEKGFEFNNA